MKQCYIGVDVGLTSAKAGAFDEAGEEVRTFSAPNPRYAAAAGQQEIDMQLLWQVVASVLSDLTSWLRENGWTPVSLGVTAAGNGIYLVDEELKPVRPAIASNDNRAEAIVANLDPHDVEGVRKITGSVPWAGQPGVLLSWLVENEPDSVEAAHHMLTCKDWVRTNLIGRAGAEVSDASACGLMSLESRAYEARHFDLLGLPRELMRLLPPLAASDEVVGTVTDVAARETGLPVGLPVVAGCLDCIASPIGAGSIDESEVTVIVGTWAINSVTVPIDREPPNVTLNALLPTPSVMAAMEVAPTSAASIEWFASLMSSVAPDGVTPPQLLHAASTVAAGADGLMFLPFIHGAPEHFGASGTFIGLKAHHGYHEMARAVAEGITQYHRHQLERMSRTSVLTEGPWTLAGGGARNALWAQLFADIVDHPVRRQLGTELGARGVALLAAAGVGADTASWEIDPDPKLVVEPGPDREIYREQSRRFDKAIAAMSAVWTEIES
ncbi:FGGY-family carbohydrate kinase [Paramicrobacterium agarici]|uniref:L-xylulokinase n=1 Tax=Paramicrobacterium agarici TaxID=630514 RepID=A0A2A9DTG7_9MICO|nr:FGGY family carbohydrate kinase [Microbacterium agarici]PFG29884.1 L-xylulokinase [Microbacterium agarici]